MLPSARDNDDHGVNAELIEEYKHLLSGKAEGTIDAYLRTIRQMMIWVAKRPGNDGYFQPQQLTKTAVEMYLAYLEREGIASIIVRG